MPISRYTIADYNTELIIWNVQQSDEGDYRCRASSANGVQENIIQIDVQGEIFVFVTVCHCYCSSISFTLLLSDLY